MKTSTYSKICSRLGRWAILLVPLLIFAPLRSSGDVITGATIYAGAHGFIYHWEGIGLEPGPFPDHSYSLEGWYENYTRTYSGESFASSTNFSSLNYDASTVYNGLLSFGHLVYGTSGSSRFTNSGKVRLLSQAEASGDELHLLTHATASQDIVVSTSEFGVSHAYFGDMQTNCVLHVKFTLTNPAVLSFAFKTVGGAI